MGAIESGPCISVVIPTHNRSASLERTLACLARQTYPADQFEVIVVDDGSEDGTESRLALGAGRGVWRYIRQRHAGRGAARNTGIRAARGSVVAFTDDDCTPEPDWLAALAQALAGPHDTGTAAVAAVGGRIQERVVDGNGVQAFYAARQERLQASSSGELERLDTANAACFRAALLAVGGFDESAPHAGLEDVELSFRLRAAGYQLLACPRAVVGHTNRTSLAGLIAQAFERGLGLGILAIDHPQHLPELANLGPYRRVQPSILQWARRTRRPWRLVMGASALAALHGVLALLWLRRWVLYRLPELRRHYASQRLAAPRTLLYLAFEGLYYTIYLTGQVVGAARRVYQPAV
jgi:glycosyltransferase involved in cell wall biosynthesis